MQGTPSKVTKSVRGGKQSPKKATMKSGPDSNIGVSEHSDDHATVKDFEDQSDEEGGNDALEEA